MLRLGVVNRIAIALLAGRLLHFLETLLLPIQLRLHPLHLLLLFLLSFVLLHASWARAFVVREMDGLIDLVHLLLQRCDLSLLRLNLRLPALGRLRCSSRRRRHRRLTRSADGGARGLRSGMLRNLFVGNHSGYRCILAQRALRLFFLQALLACDVTQRRRILCVRGSDKHENRSPKNENELARCTHGEGPLSIMLCARGLQTSVTNGPCTRGHRGKVRGHKGPPPCSGPPLQ